MSKVGRWLILTPLFYLGFIFAFGQATMLLFIGPYVVLILGILALIVSHRATVRYEMSVKKAATFTAGMYVFQLLVDWFVKNDVLPSTSSWTGVGFHLLLGCLVLYGVYHVEFCENEAARKNPHT